MEKEGMNYDAWPAIFFFYCFCAEKMIYYQSMYCNLGFGHHNIVSIIEQLQNFNTYLN